MNVNELREKTNEVTRIYDKMVKHEFDELQNKVNVLVLEFEKKHGAFVKALEYTRQDLENKKPHVILHYGVLSMCPHKVMIELIKSNPLFSDFLHTLSNQ